MRESYKVIIYYIKILGSSKIISPYGKKQLQRYTASPFPSCVVNSLILFLSTGMRSRCIKYLKWDRRRLFIKSHFFFLCIFLYYWSLVLIFALLNFSLFHVLTTTIQLPINQNAYAKRGPFIHFDQISTSPWIPFYVWKTH